MLRKGSSPMDAGERAARERLNALFRVFDRLTPDELARIGYRRAPREDRDPLSAAVDEAAVRTGRVVLVGEARDAAREAVLTRYSAGALHPTFVGLNWGISQGTIEARVAIAETLADAAAAAVVADALDPEIATALALDAASITDLAAGEASDGSLARALRDPEDPDLGAGPVARRLRWIGAAVMVAASAIMTEIGVVGAAAVGVVVGVRALIRGGERDR
jgi:hypothetical protein